MKRSKKIVFVSHCLLNQNARAQTVAKTPGICREFVDFCVKKKWGMVPIDCPQLEFEPLIREPETKETYQNSLARKISRKISEKVAKQIKMYLDEGYKVEGIFGVEGSPSCGVTRTHVLSKEGKSVGVKASGVFVEELLKILDIFDWDIQGKKTIKLKR
jgi:predicted secreted protein